MIQELKNENFKQEYGILCHRFFPKEGAKTPFGATWCVVEPDKSTSPHGHHEGETFFILDGTGVMSIDGRKSQVKKGDAVFIPPFSEHVLTNDSGTENLVFLSVYWEGAPGETN